MVVSRQITLNTRRDGRLLGEGFTTTVSPKKVRRRACTLRYFSLEIFLSLLHRQMEVVSIDNAKPSNSAGRLEL